VHRFPRTFASNEVALGWFRRSIVLLQGNSKLQRGFTSFINFSLTLSLSRRTTFVCFLFFYPQFFCSYLSTMSSIKIHEDAPAAEAPSPAAEAPSPSVATSPVAGSKRKIVLLNITNTRGACAKLVATNGKRDPSIHVVENGIKKETDIQTVASDDFDSILDKIDNVMMKVKELEAASAEHATERDADRITINNLRGEVNRLEQGRAIDGITIKNLQRDRAADRITINNLRVEVNRLQQGRAVDGITINNLQRDRAADRITIDNLQRDRAADRITIDNLQERVAVLEAKDPKNGNLVYQMAAAVVELHSAIQRVDAGTNQDEAQDVLDARIHLAYSLARYKKETQDALEKAQAAEEKAQAAEAEAADLKEKLVALKEQNTDYEDLLKRGR
jgi:chromosome segregation ATPase